MRAFAIAVLTCGLASSALAQAPAQPASGKPASNMLEALAAAGLDPRTKVEDQKVQVMLGQRAVIRLDAKGAPVLDEVDTGRVGQASPDGKGETYQGVGAGKLAFALDASPEKRQSLMKVWNGLAHPMAYEAEITAVRQGKLMKRITTICPVPAGGVNYEVWADPIVAVTLSKFAEAPADKTTCQ